VRGRIGFCLGLADCYTSIWYDSFYRLDAKKIGASDLHIDISGFSDMAAGPRFSVSPYIPTTYVKKKSQIIIFLFLVFSLMLGVDKRRY
jgi:hypothetical protein